MELIGTNTMDAWKKTLTYIMDHGTDFKDDEQRTCRECLNLVVTIANPANDYDTPIEEMRRFDWIYPSKEELSAIMLQREISGIHEYSYGPRLFNFGRKKDQIHEFIIPLLRSNPHTRRAVLTIYDPSVDSDMYSKSIPSLMSIFFKIVDNKLCMTCFFRSNDFFIAWPANSYQIFILQEHVAQQLGISTGSITIMSGSAHLFVEQLDMIKTIVRK